MKEEYRLAREEARTTFSLQLDTYTIKTATDEPWAAISASDAGAAAVAASKASEAPPRGPDLAHTDAISPEAASSASDAIMAKAATAAVAASSASEAPPRCNVASGSGFSAPTEPSGSGQTEALATTRRASYYRECRTGPLGRALAQ